MVIEATETAEHTRLTNAKLDRRCVKGRRRSPGCYELV